MLAASGRAQADSPVQPAKEPSANRSWSTKHLSATGKDGIQSVRATQLSGAAVNDASGQPMATLEDTIINPVSGRVEFGLLSLKSAAGGSTTAQSAETASSGAPNKLVPVPWSLLKMKSSSSQYSSSSEKPTFTLSVDQAKLNAAPTVQSSDLGQAEWQQRVYAYYGVTPAPMGAAESPAGESKGEGAKGMQKQTPPPQPMP